VPLIPRPPLCGKPHSVILDKVSALDSPHYERWYIYDRYAHFDGNQVGIRHGFPTNIALQIAYRE